MFPLSYLNHRIIAANSGGKVETRSYCLMSSKYQFRMEKEFWRWVIVQHHDCISFFCIIYFKIIKGPSIMKHTPGIIAHKKWEQENQEFRIILRYKEILKTTWTK